MLGWGGQAKRETLKKKTSQDRTDCDEECLTRYVSELDHFLQMCCYLERHFISVCTVILSACAAQRKNKNWHPSFRTHKLIQAFLLLNLGSIRTELTWELKYGEREELWIKVKRPSPRKVNQTLELSQFDRNHLDFCLVETILISSLLLDFFCWL